MAITHHSQTSDFQRTAQQFHRDHFVPKVYDKEDHMKFALWYFARLHKVLTQSELDRTQKSFIYDMDYYMSLPNPSKNIEIL